MAAACAAVSGKCDGVYHHFFVYPKKADSTEGWDLLDHFQLFSDPVFGLSRSVGMAFRVPWDTVSIQLCVPDTDFPTGMSSVFPDHPDIPAGDEELSADTDSCDSPKTGG